MSTSEQSDRWRLRAIHRKMSFETFQRTVPIRPGWKREYYGGKAHVRPSWVQVTFELALASRPPLAARQVRAMRRDDEAELVDAFRDSFRVAPEYADYPMKAFRKKADEYVRGFFGDVRGTWSPASSVVVRGGQIVAAAFIKNRAESPPLLDCLLVRPAFVRQGLATAVVTRVVNELTAAGVTTLRSCAMLANETSIAWHTAYGFRELPDYFVAQARWRCAACERERLEELGQLTPAMRERLTILADTWLAEVHRLEAMPFDSRFSGLSD